MSAVEFSSDCAAASRPESCAIRPESCAIPHHRSVAAQAPRRFRGNARPVVQLGLARLATLFQRFRGNVQHNLIPLRSRA